MKKSSNVFIDTSAWLAILNPDDGSHEKARAYYAGLLERGARLFTNNIVLDETLDRLKREMGNKVAMEFMAIIDEGVLSLSIRLDWISRRVRRSAIEYLLSSRNDDLTLNHFYILETLRRKRIDIVFSFDRALRAFDFPIMPQGE
ncbi:MAG TPA: PIN domain-containing protein [Caldithrix abyssi]|uniref:PIN domain-containing protein n=1 Tax=Caldithrix abyssi TaxID=187145 RepID=A0A7V5RNA1_CALAY|nr:PIN domain-containing protein [Caldithrix abyssi]